MSSLLTFILMIIVSVGFVQSCTEQGRKDCPSDLGECIGYMYAEAEQSISTGYERYKKENTK